MPKEREAEVAAEHFLKEHFYCTHIYRAIRTKYHRVDIMACDVVGKTVSGLTYWVQVTTGGMNAVNQRKRKLKEIPWNGHDRVLMFQLKEGKDGRKKIWGFRVWEYKNWVDEWREWPSLIEVPRKWFRVKTEPKMSALDI